MDVKDRLRSHFAANRERFAEEVRTLVGELVALRTVNAGLGRMDECPGQEVPGEETRVVDLLRPRVEALGAKTAVHALSPRRANLLASIGGDGGGPVLAVGCHSDIVPPGEGWDTDPYLVHESDGFLYGRGVLDNKGPIASAFLAMKLLVECEVPLSGEFLLAIIASEEYHEAGESDPGIEYLLETGVLKPDFAIIPDIGENMRRIDIAEKGRAEIVVTALGRQAHGSTPELGDNAVYRMARLIPRVEDLRLAHSVHPVLGSPTINLGLIRGGAAANIVPGQCSITLDIRFVPGQSAPAMVEELRALTADLGGAWKFEVRNVTVPHAISADHELVKTVQRNAAPLLGFVPEPFGMGGGTFAKSFNLGGIPAIGFGPGDDEQFHVANERVELAQLVDFALLLSLVSVDLLA